jgi:hypothetical protein
MKKNTLIILILLLICLPIYAYAEIKMISATHTYKMGDNDSRNEARRICFLEAKRSVLEKAGTYIESRTEVRNYQLSKDEVSAYSSALLTVDTVNEKWEDMAITITVKATVDTDYINKQISNIKKDVSLQNELKAQQDKIMELERTVTSMQDKLKSADATEATPLKKERNVVIKSINTLEAKKIEIQERIIQKSRDAKKYITEGMTMSDVKSLLGEPDGRIADHYGGLYWIYGKTSVYFNAGGLVYIVTGGL